MKQWYVVQAYSGYEKHVIRSLRERVQRGHARRTVD